MASCSGSFFGFTRRRRPREGEGTRRPSFMTRPPSRLHRRSGVSCGSGLTGTSGGAGTDPEERELEPEDYKDACSIRLGNQELSRRRERDGAGYSSDGWLPPSICARMMESGRARPTIGGDSWSSGARTAAIRRWWIPARRRGGERSTPSRWPGCPPRTWGRSARTPAWRRGLPQPWRREPRLRATVAPGRRRC